MNRTELPIPAPCQADWSTMTLAERGRFCGACRKVVRELAQMTEDEARALLASPPTEGLCVRYVHDATGEIVFRRDRVVPLARLVRRAAGVALAVTLPLSSAACMGAAPTMGAPPPAVEPPAQVLMGSPPVPEVMPPPAASSSDTQAPPPGASSATPESSSGAPAGHKSSCAWHASSPKS